MDDFDERFCWYESDAKKMLRDGIIDQDDYDRADIIPDPFPGYPSL